MIDLRKDFQFAINNISNWKNSYERKVYVHRKLLINIMFRAINTKLVYDAFKNGVPWSSLIMCAATLTLGAALQNNDIGLISYLQTTLGPALNSLPEIFLLIIFAFWAALQTNLSSNMVTATLVATVASTILLSTTNTLNISATICIIGMLASFAFATPPSMPHIAIICSDESTSTKDVLIYGSIMMILSVLVSLLVAYPLGTLIF